MIENTGRNVEGVTINTEYRHAAHCYLADKDYGTRSGVAMWQSLGHHAAAFTLDTYGHVSEKMKQKSVNRMEAHISAPKNL